MARSNGRKEAAWQQSDDLIERSENIHVASIGWPDHTVRTEPRGTARTAYKIPRGGDLMVRSKGREEATWHKYNGQIQWFPSAQICGLESATCREQDHRLPDRTTKIVRILHLLAYVAQIQRLQ
jgi:hypothetical protein